MCFAVRTLLHVKDALHFELYLRGIKTYIWKVRYLDNFITGNKAVIIADKSISKLESINSFMWMGFYWTIFCIFSREFPFVSHNFNVFDVEYDLYFDQSLFYYNIGNKKIILFSVARISWKFFFSEHYLWAFPGVLPVNCSYLFWKKLKVDGKRNAKLHEQKPTTVIVFMWGASFLMFQSTGKWAFKS